MDLNQNYQYPVGSVVEFTTENGKHWGVHVGDELIVHSVKNSDFDARYFSQYVVQISPISDVGNPSGEAYTTLFSKEADHPTTVLDRAFQEVGNKISYNSLEFTKYCLYGYDLRILKVLIVAIGIVLAVLNPSAIKAFCEKLAEYEVVINRTFAIITLLGLMLCIITQKLEETYVRPKKYKGQFLNR
ncbi:hypothetical protein BgiBS90_028184 [Biomphalaria glabrata]|nr:hypothetical protein BgiBS90_028184 [Biomphalaria glabrata]